MFTGCSPDVECMQEVKRDLLLDGQVGTHKLGGSTLERMRRYSPNNKPSKGFKVAKAIEAVVKVLNGVDRKV
jgi:hypothetical protein